MKIEYIFAIIIVALIIGGCATKQTQQTIQINSCPNRCSNESVLKENIESYFNITQDSYNITCSECVEARGGHINANITINNTPVELFYHWGWCSSGGTDCGYKMIFSIHSASNDDLYNRVKNDFCNKLQFNSRNDEHICTGESYDYSNETRISCLNGKFESINGTNKILSIDQISNRCANSVSIGNFT